MNKMGKSKIIILISIIATLLLYFLVVLLSETSSKEETDNLLAEKPNALEPAILSVSKVQATRCSSQEIEVTWPDDLDEDAACYLVKRRMLVQGGTWGEWDVVAEVPSDGISIGEHIRVMDNLPDDTIRQYEYSVGVQTQDSSKYVGGDSSSVLASNLLICIDPGHYVGANQMYGEESYGYAEGDATLTIGLFLQQYLKDSYGIDSCMTRTGGNISLGGYTNSALDSRHLSLRGVYAGETGSDLFVSLHTNANEDNANGYPTCSQPISMNKPILILNTTACASLEAIEIANKIGSNLAEVSFAQGISAADYFHCVIPSEITQWTDSYNDGTDLPGTVFCRLDEDGNDYYGILRGANSVCVPGIIIEHGMHTVPEVRRAAMGGDLLMHWAMADACGIAEGFGFVPYGE